MKMRSRLAILMMAVSVGQVVRAADLIWDPAQSSASGTDGSGTWDLVTPNWYNPSLAAIVVWTNGSNALFGSTSQAGVNGVATNDVDLASAIEANNIVLGTTAAGGTYTLSDFGGGHLTLDGNFSKVSSASNPIVLLTSGMTLSSAAHTFTIRDSSGDAAPELNFTGPISGGGSVILDNSSAFDSYGTLVFSADNTYTGTTTITKGRLGIISNNGLGSTSAGTTVGALGTLAIGASGTGSAAANLTIAEPITITRSVYTGAGVGTGTDAQNYGAAVETENGSGTTTFTGPFIVDSNDARIGANTSTLTVTSNITVGPDATMPSLSVTGDYAGYVHLTGNNTALTGGVSIIAQVQLDVDNDNEIGGASAPLNFVGGGTYRPVGGYATSFGTHVINNATFNGGINVDVNKTFTIDQPLGSTTTAIGSLGKRGLGTLNINSAVNLRGGSTYFDLGVVNVNSSVTLTSLFLRSPTLNIGNGGSVTTTGGFDSLGVDSKGTNGGPDIATINITGTGSFTEATGDDFNLSDNANTQGTINLRDNGVLTTGGITALGKSAGATGTINQYGGTFNVNRTGNFGLVLGDRDGTGNYNLSGGVLTVNSETYVGEGGSGVGVWTQTGGTANLKDWFVVGREGAKGTVNFSGGTITHTGGNVSIGDSSQDNVMTMSNNAIFDSQSGEFYVGNNGGSKGTLYMSGTTVLNVNNWFVVGRAGAVGLLDISGGTITKTGDNNSYVGENDSTTSVFNVHGTAVVKINAGEFWLGNDGSSAGTLNVADSSSFTVNSWLAVGRNGTAKGFINLSGGTLTKATTNGFFDLGSGDNGVGLLTQTGGTLNSTQSFIGENGTGTANLSAGSANFGPLVIGVTGGSSNGHGGTLNISGTAAVTAGTVFMGGTATGTTNANSAINITGGSFTATSIAPGTSTGTRNFSFTGGTLSVGNYSLAGPLLNTGTGTLSPGGPAGFGTTTIANGYTQGSTGTLAFNIGSSGQDGVSIAGGSATLNGTLALSVVGTNPLLYTPVTLLSAPTISGKFSAITGIRYASNRALAVTYSGTAVTIQAAIPGDANFSGKVEFNDLVALAQNYNTTGADWSKGDFDGNTNVNFNDLVILAQFYGQTGAAGTALVAGSGFSDNFKSDWALAQSLAVPEPTALSLLGLTGLLAIRNRRPSAVTQK